MYREGEVGKVNGSKASRHAEICNEVLGSLDNEKSVLDCRSGILRRLTIGSCEMGLVDICTLGSGPIPGAFSVQAC